ncbi:MAG TPA: sorbosone dehydrogenase family protein [Gemmatimonadaceae bacterium]|nr:sorbosone dehydrogenase family protein [Gemmatimonadaceae bacterium]
MRRDDVRSIVHVAIPLILTAGFAACGAPARVPVAAASGVRPVIPPPKESIVPVINVVTAKGWRDEHMPVAADGLAVRPFARGLDHPRWLYVLPNGDVLVAETNAPKRPDDGKGIKGFFFRLFLSKGGGAAPSQNRIVLLRDTDGDGVADTKSIFLSGLYAPFGMTLVGNQLYVANSDAIVRVPYVSGATSITAAPVKVVDLPGGRINHHWTKNVIASADGSKLYASVGSNSNVAENDLLHEQGRAAIWEIDRATGKHRIFATGLRNPVGLAWEPESGKLWVAVNERDELGSDLVPDYITSVRDGGFYGWPFSYYGRHTDYRVSPQKPGLIERAIVPDYALGSHTASLGLTWSDTRALPARFNRGMFVGQHGSWNRKPFSGYKVIFVPFDRGRPSGKPIDVLTGFIQPNGDAMGRPVGVAIDKSGALLVADDVGNTIWRVTREAGSGRREAGSAGPDDQGRSNER